MSGISRLNRREFLKLGAMAGVGLLLPVWKMSPARAETAAALDPATQPQFVNDVPNALDPSFKYEITGGTAQVGMFQIEQWLGLVDPSDGVTHINTTVWAYGEYAQSATYPGWTFEVRKDQPLDVQWTNNLVDGQGNPLPHLLPVDISLHWAYALHGYESYTLENDGVPVVPHLHGGHTESDSDGNPEYFWTPNEGIKGPRFVKSLYHYDNDQESGTLWYHDHTLGITRLNVYAGLAGFYIIRDDQDTGLASNPLGLPAYPYESAMVIQDRRFDDTGQLLMPTSLAEEGFPGQQPSNDISAIAEFFGDFILVNGVIWPKKDVEPRQYRLRFLNGSDSRFYVLKLTEDNSDVRIPFYQIGTDNGLLAQPVQLDQLVLGPGERADLIVDFSDYDGGRLILKNDGPDAPFGGLPVDPQDYAANHAQTTGLVMAFDVNQPFNASRPDNFDPTTAVLRSDGGFAVSEPAVRTRKLALFEGTDNLGRLQPLLGTAEPTRDLEGNVVNKSLAWFEPITEAPALDDVEIWEIYNVTEDAHPVHVHLVSFEVINREAFDADVDDVPQPMHDGTFGTGGQITNITLGGSPTPPMDNEKGPKDTVQVYPGEVTRVKAKFDRPGRYVWHCHILSHEDHEMMRPMHVLNKTFMPLIANG